MTEDYKKTLNLPHTNFPMKANLPQQEPQRIAKWQSEALYDKLREQNKGKKKFILHMGPPYANGNIHIGHAVTTVLKDIVVKAKTLSGFDAPLVPGWDCHGLPIEVNVEKKMKENFSPAVFRQACREYALSQIALQKASFIRLGILADWERPYTTMDFGYEAEVIRTLGKIGARGHLQAGAKPVHWCVSCGSALAEAEVEYQLKTSFAIDVCFHAVDPKGLCHQLGIVPLEKIVFVAWTTTPWTLPANQAIVLHPTLVYVLVKKKGESQAFCIAKELLDASFARYGMTGYEPIASFKGAQIEHYLVQHPFYERDVPIVLGEHVTLETGTGIVHTAPGHGLEDYSVGLQYGLSVETPVGDNGCFFDETPLVGGLFVFKSNEKVIEILKEKNTLLHIETLSHSYPHCWRHKTPLIFRSTPQWFVSMDKHQLRTMALEAIDEVKWIPGWGQTRLHSMIEGRPDWCISRQRAWGVPLPFLVHKETGDVHPDMEAIIEIIANEVEKKGIEAWYEFDFQGLPFENMKAYRKLTDILDVWFDAGVSHTSVLKKRPELQFPADLYLEGSDQHRGWFQSSLLTSLALYEEAPYRAVLTHGFTVDAQGRKMSKSLGNVISPEEVIKSVGADVLRLWVASTDYKGEIHVSQEILTRLADAYRRIRNTLRFLLANLNGFDPLEAVPHEQWLALDAWIVDHAAALQEEIMDAYHEAQFHMVYQKIHQFCIVELGSFYLDIIKDRQYTTKVDSLARRSAQTALYHIAHALTRWIAPILSFTAEEAWTHLPGEKASSIFLTEWHKDLPRLCVNIQMNALFWQNMINVRDNVNKILEKERVAGKLGAPLEAEVTLYADNELYQQLQWLQEELYFVLITSRATVKPLAEKTQTAVPTGDQRLWVDVVLSASPKCVRCWHRRETVNQQVDYPGLCDRCVENVQPSSKGEERHYA